MGMWDRIREVVTPQPENQPDSAAFTDESTMA